MKRQYYFKTNANCAVFTGVKTINNFLGWINLQNNHMGTIAFKETKTDQRFLLNDFKNIGNPYLIESVFYPQPSSSFYSTEMFPKGSRLELRLYHTPRTTPLNSYRAGLKVVATEKRICSKKEFLNFKDAEYIDFNDGSILFARGLCL